MWPGHSHVLLPGGGCAVMVMFHLYQLTGEGQHMQVSRCKMLHVMLRVIRLQSGSQHSLSSSRSVTEPQHYYSAVVLLHLHQRTHDSHA